ncbi:MAG: T9SS type A sorting domain-containing protein [Prolixibacteraceae bacterium]|jgi:hypothetical protein|nr:T9SS type A sorting domain-containing protein [Prolixibacteraceae bacterium]
MRVFFLTAIFFFVMINGFSQSQWHKGRMKVQPPVCYGSGKVSQTYVEPPYELLNRLKSTGQQNATIIVQYDSDFEADAEARAAFEAAVQIWEGLISSPVPIYLYANWEELDEDVLGSCFSWDHYANLDFMPLKNTYYAGALVEKMKGQQITDSSIPDIYARFNKSNKNWYFGLDGKTPKNKYDFLTVVLHEIGHGLGYSGMSYGDTAKFTGGFYYPYDDKYYPGIYDQYLVNKDNQKLADVSLFQNPSSSLYLQFQSEYLLFNKQLPFDDTGYLTFPRLFAPPEWDAGSSIDHLNENTYAEGTTNSLMTPFLDLGEAIHNPGLLTLEMLYEMGWKFIQISHDELPDIEKIEDLKKAEVYINSDYALDSTRLYMIYSSDEFIHADTVLLLPTTTQNKFEALLPIATQGTVKYYFSASNTGEREFRMPGIAPEKTYSVTFGNDNIVPVATHEPSSFMRAEELSVEIVVNATDNLGINSVKMEYLVNKAANPSTLVLTRDSINIYKGILSFPESSLADGDSVRYRIIVEDKSVNKNTSVLPRKGYYTVYIQGTYDPVRQYFSDFNATNTDFISSDFTVVTPTGFDNGALHSLHPYKSPEKENASYNYSAQLKYPIIIKNGGIITYDEVVLVEPGEPGALFGSNDFYDYVIVEGSKDKGKTWKPLVDGYDSGSNANWELVYNVGISGNNSTSAGSKNLYVRREFPINGKENFTVGDTILIRFRLYSDPYANGWGWCIDNLNIQDPNTAVAPLAYSLWELTFYPNPVTDNLIIQGIFKENTNHLKLSVYNNSGQLIQQKQIHVTENSFHTKLGMSDFAPGLYLITIDFENGQRISRKAVKK